MLFRRARSQAPLTPNSRLRDSKEELDPCNGPIGRRGLAYGAVSLVSAVAATAVAGSSRAVAQQIVSPAKARIAAPRDCFVKDVIAVEGATLSQGDSIAVLDTEDEDKSMDRIALANQFIAIQEAALSESQIAIRRTILQSTINVANSYLDYAKSRRDAIQYESNHGLIGGDQAPFGNDILIRQCAAAVTRATAELDRAKSALDLFNFNVIQARQKLDLIKSVIPKEQSSIIAAKTRLTIVSPITGRVHLNCYKSAFLQKGVVIAEIS
jgi:hypothetical protein